MFKNRHAIVLKMIHIVNYLHANLVNLISAVTLLLVDILDVIFKINRHDSLLQKYICCCECCTCMVTQPLLNLLY